jgi:hypothetical protein
MNATESVVDFRCEQCRRSAGSEMWHCPQRPRNICPYEKQRVEGFKSRLFGIAWTLFSLFWTVGWIRQQGPELGAGDLLGALMGILFVGIGFYMVLHTTQQLYHPGTKLKWNRIMLLGFTLSRRLTEGGELLSHDLELSRHPRFPASTSQLIDPTGSGRVRDMDLAVALVRAALVSLLAQGFIQIQRHRQFTAQWQGPLRESDSVYAVLLMGQPKISQVAGELERALLKVLYAWHERDDGRQWPDGPPVFNLVSAVFKRDYDSPAKQLCKFVEDDAVRAGLGRRVGLVRRFEFDAIGLEQLLLEQEAVNGLLEQLRQKHSDAYMLISSEIRRAIQSRVKDDSGPMW